MTKGRLEAFSDGVLAIIITIMVLELKVPHEPSPEALLALWPIFSSYILSFSDHDGALNALLSQLTAAGHTIRAIDTRPPALADVLRHYTEETAPAMSSSSDHG